MQLIDMESEQRIDEVGVPPVKIVAGNKCDLKEGRVISSRQGLEWARGRGCGFMETSAREMVNIEETFARVFECPLLSFLRRNAMLTGRNWNSDSQKGSRSTTDTSLRRVISATWQTRVFILEDTTADADDGKATEAGEFRSCRSTGWQDEKGRILGTVEVLVGF